LRRLKARSVIARLHDRLSSGMKPQLRGLDFSLSTTWSGKHEDGADFLHHVGRVCRSLVR
jgi:hypothetical protein